MPSSLVKGNGCFRGTYHFHLQHEAGSKPISVLPFHAGILIGLLLTLKMEAICSSETLADLQQMMWHYMKDGKPLYKLYV
jgi:hypothetical protein